MFGRVARTHYQRERMVLLSDPNLRFLHTHGTRCPATCSAQIAVQIAVVFGRVARTDYPRDWPGLFSDLLGLLAGPDMLTQRRVYLTLHHILKELATKRLMADQKNFAQVH